MLDARIPLMAEGIPLEPRRNALMRAAEMAGMQQRQQMNALQMQQMQVQAQEALRQRQTQEERQRQMDAYLASLSGDAGPPQAFNPVEALRRVGPENAKTLQGFFDKPDEKLMTVAPGAAVFDPRTRQPVFTAPVKPDTPPELVRLMQFRDTLPQGDPRRATIDAAIGKATTHAPAAQMNNYGSPVPAVDDKGNPVFIRTTKDGLEPAIIPGVRPPKSGAEEKAEAEKKDRQRQGQQMLSVMDDAEKILKQGKTTASGVGTVTDAAARAVGITTVGAQDSARLQALSGWLVANVPRMEGPQSNYDVQNYMTMAGKVGDSTVPVPERLAALQTVRTLQKKYAQINGTPAASEAPAVRRYNPQTGRIE